MSARRFGLVPETPARIRKRPPIVVVEPRGLSRRERGRRGQRLSIAWAQVWSRAAVIAPERKRAVRHGRGAPELA